MTVTNIDDFMSNADMVSMTAISRVQKQRPYSIVEKLLEELDRKGMQLLGIKMAYFCKKSLEEYNSYVDHLNIDVNVNKPLIVLAVGGIDTFNKLKKTVGSDNIQYAKKKQANSFNAVFYSKNEDTILQSADKLVAKKMIQYFFSGRLEKIQDMEFYIRFFFKWT